MDTFTGDVSSLAAISYGAIARRVKDQSIVHRACTHSFTVAIDTASLHVRLLQHQDQM